MGKKDASLAEARVMRMKKQQQAWMEQRSKAALSAPVSQPKEEPREAQVVPQEKKIAISNAADDMSQKCPICVEYMLAPLLPMMLFPCGHTVCQQCLTQHHSTNSYSCPECNAEITSQAINQTLKKLLEMSLQGSAQAAIAKSSKINTALQANKDAKGKQQRRREYDAFEVRKLILSRELDNIRSKQAEFDDEKLHLAKIEKRFKNEIKGFENDIQNIREEIKKVDLKIDNNQILQKQAIANKDALEDKCSLIQQTIRSMDDDMQQLQSQF